MWGENFPWEHVDRGSLGSNEKGWRGKKKLMNWDPWEPGLRGYLIGFHRTRLKITGQEGTVNNLTVRPSTHLLSATGRSRDGSPNSMNFMP
jgi:hypothetical protein